MEKKVKNQHLEIDPLIREQKDVFEQTRIQGLKYDSREKNPNRKIINLEEVRAKRKEGEVENNENILNEESLRDIAHKSVHSLLSDKERKIFDENREKINKIVEEMKSPVMEKNDDESWTEEEKEKQKK